VSTTLPGGTRPSAAIHAVRRVIAVGHHHADLDPAARAAQVRQPVPEGEAAAALRAVEVGVETPAASVAGVDRHGMIGSVTRGVDEETTTRHLVAAVPTAAQIERSGQRSQRARQRGVTGGAGEDS
jgi:hypothetical protein